MIYNGLNLLIDMALIAIVSVTGYAYGQRDGYHEGWKDASDHYVG